ncbi:MAG: hypothetical protein N3A38_05610 [Planctomycetota bacterium]|nr:hypothetical protein [Planctomycetota bacterium]
MSGPDAVPPAPAPGPAGRGKFLTGIAFVLAGLGLLVSAAAVFDTVVTWRAFSRWQPSEFTVSRWLSARIFSMVRGGMPKDMLRIEGYLQALAILSWPVWGVPGMVTGWLARRKSPRDSRSAGALKWLLLALACSLPVSAVSSYISWQCVFVSPKEVFEKRVARRAAGEGREPTPDEEARASELGARYDEWRRESVFRLFMSYTPEPDGPRDPPDRRPASIE